ncbi:MAG: ankyrin repeat domain-containing protein [Wolbachia sp.]|nr:ankyrin repeat domain-containing protein [Wolbachia sp.]
MAALNGHTEVVDILIKAVVNLDAINNGGDTPLSKAAYHINIKYN